MKVKELIAELQKHDPEMLVKVNPYDGANEVEAQNVRVENGCVIIDEVWEPL